MDSPMVLINRRLRLPLILVLGFAGLLWAALYSSLPALAGYLSYSVLGLNPNSRLGTAVAFFLYDVPKIFLLLAAVVFIVGIIRSFFTPDRARRILGGKNEGAGYVLASGLGAVTPFCSCSAVPLFLGFVESGVPLGVTFAFLISAPLVSEVAVVMLFGLFGWQVAALYLLTGMAIAVVAGWVIGRLGLDRYVADWVYEVCLGQSTLAHTELRWEDRIDYAWASVRGVIGRVWLFVIVGIGIGAFIHGYVPENIMAGIMGTEAWWSVPMAVFVGIPMYANAAGIVPVVQALVEKGAAMGTVLAFMMSVIALSLPELIILRRVLKWQLIVVFVGVVGMSIMLVGYLFNAIL